jgi:hypothetical protein
VSCARLAIVVLSVATTGACAAPQRKLPPLRATPASWCTPARGAPPDPTLGLTRPIRIGIGSLLQEQDGTTESFLARDRWAALDWVDGRDEQVVLVDHPADADYTISGSLTGAISYDYETRAAPVIPAVGYGAGFSIGGALLALGIIFDAVGSEPDPTPYYTGGLVGLGMAGAAAAYVWSRPANEYHWSEMARFTLRRNGVRIGEFSVVDQGVKRRWSPDADYRRHALERLWRKARDAIAPCITRDLEQDT